MSSLTQDTGENLTTEIPPVDADHEKGEGFRYPNVSFDLTRHSTGLFGNGVVTTSPHMRLVSSLRSLSETCPDEYGEISEIRGNNALKRLHNYLAQTVQIHGESKKRTSLLPINTVLDRLLQQGREENDPVAQLLSQIFAAADTRSESGEQGIPEQDRQILSRDVIKVVCADEIHEIYADFVNRQRLFEKQASTSKPVRV